MSNIDIEAPVQTGEGEPGNSPNEQTPLTLKPSKAANGVCDGELGDIHGSVGQPGLDIGYVGIDAGQGGKGAIGNIGAVVECRIPCDSMTMWSFKSKGGRGQKGGPGGIGGRGGRGGPGGDGGDGASCCSTLGVRGKGGRGGQGERGGQGGKGGKGGEGGTGGTGGSILVEYPSDKVPPAVESPGGDSGAGGAPGYPGQGGYGGYAGSPGNDSSGSCPGGGDNGTAGEGPEGPQNTSGVDGGDGSQTPSQTGDADAIPYECFCSGQALQDCLDILGTLRPYPDCGCDLPDPSPILIDVSGPV